MSEAQSDTRDMMTVFIESLSGADRVVVETKNALGEMDAHYMHAPAILDAWNTRQDPKVKALEWHRGYDCGYACFYAWGGGVKYVARIDESGLIRSGDAKTTEEEMAVHEETHKRRILSALKGKEE